MRSLQELYDFHNGNFSAIAREVGLSREAVRLWYKKLGLTGTGKRLNKAEVEKIKSQKFTRYEICKILKRNPGTISKYSEGVKLPHGNLKYSNEQIFNALRNSNGNITSAAKDLGTIFSSLSRLLKNRGISAKDFK